MAYPTPARCPVCGGAPHVVRLHCSSCGTTIEGRFQASPLSRLTAEQRDFVVTFLKVRGNLREMERELGVSYPTVRNRLDGVLKALGYEVEREAAREEDRRQVLAALERGELTAEEAVRRLKGNWGKDSLE